VKRVFVVAVAVLGLTACGGTDKPSAPQAAPSNAGPTAPLDGPADLRHWVPDVSAPVGLLADGNLLWVAASSADKVLALDPATGKVVATVAVGDAPLRLAGGGGAVWVSNFRDGTVSRIDPAAHTVTATYPIGPEPEGLAWAAGATAIIIRPRSRTAFRIAPETPNPRLRS